MYWDCAPRVRKMEQRPGLSNLWEYLDFESLLDLWLLNARSRTQCPNGVNRSVSKRV